MEAIAHCRRLMRHFDDAFDAGLKGTVVAKVEGFAEADGEDIGVIGNGTDVLAIDPDFDAGLGVDALDGGTGRSAQEPFVRTAVFDRRIEREPFPADAIERRRHERRCHGFSVICGGWEKNVLRLGTKTGTPLRHVMRRLGRC